MSNRFQSLKQSTIHREASVVAAITFHSNNGLAHKIQWSQDNSHKKRTEHLCELSELMINHIYRVVYGMIVRIIRDVLHCTYTYVVVLNQNNLMTKYKLGDGSVILK